MNGPARRDVPRRATSIAFVARSHHSSVAQRQSIRLLTGGLLVRIQPEEPISLTKSGTSDGGALSEKPLCPFLALFFFALPFGLVGDGGGGGSSRLTSAERNAGDRCA